MARWKPDAEGRLTAAALALFEAPGYDETTVAEIAAAAGLTKRTFFRYFADKREVLFHGAVELQQCWVDGIAAAPPDATPMAAVLAGLDRVSALFAERHAFARVRARIIASHPELQERELIKLQTLAGAIEEALVPRGVATNPAGLAAQAGVTVFHVAFGRWIALNGADSGVLRSLMDDALAELHAVTSG